MVHEDKEESTAPYEAPRLTKLGSAAELTLGPNGGPNADGLFPHHSSGG